jgi:hypothetical protein
LFKNYLSDVNVTQCNHNSHIQKGGENNRKYRKRSIPII